MVNNTQDEPRARWGGSNREPERPGRAEEEGGARRGGKRRRATSHRGRGGGQPGRGGSTQKTDGARKIRDLAKRRAQKYRVMCSAAKAAGLIVRETEALKKELSITLQDALS